MVMDALSPQSVGREFVRQYYTLLNKAPLHLHRFYSGDSSFVHGGLDKEDKKLEPVHGQQEIHEKIMQLNFRDCYAKIRQVDSHATLAQGVVVQVLGELSNNNQPLRRFVQTFVLAPQSPKKYYVYNDIFRYQDEFFSDDDSTTSDNANTSFDAQDASSSDKSFRVAAAPGGTQTQPVVAPPPPNDGIATVSIIDGVQNEAPAGPHLNGGGGGGGSGVNELSPRVPVEVVAEEPDEIEAASQEDVDEDVKEAVEDDETVEAAASAVVEEKTNASQETPSTASVTSTTTPAAVSVASSAASTTTTTSNASEAAAGGVMTYANLFKKSGGPIGASSGSISLPPAGFGKTTSTAAAGGSGTSQATSSSSSTVSPTTTASSSGGGGGGSNLKEGSPAAGFQGGKPFRGGGGGRGGRGGGVGGGNTPTSRDRYHPSRDSVSSNVAEDSGSNTDRNSGGQQQPQQRGGGSRIGMNSLSNYPDSHQVFVGNLPHHCIENNLEDLFSKFGKVVDVRINNKGVAQSKNLPDSQKSVPNFGFVVFEDEKAANECLSQKPIHLPNGHRLNVETKKKNNRDDGRGAFSGSSGGANRGQGSGNSFDRGSQEHLGGLGRGGLNSNSGRGNSRGGVRGGRGGFSGGRGSGPPSQGGGGAIPGGGNAQQRTTFTRRS